MSDIAKSWRIAEPLRPGRFALEQRTRGHWCTRPRHDHRSPGEAGAATQSINKHQPSID
jgi:hypothetical protein